jgi:hypothetical protein
MMATPADSSLRRVCAKWFLFVLGKPTNMMYDQAIRSAIYSNGVYANARDLDVGIPAQRDQHSSLLRTAPQAENIVFFLRSFHDLSEFLPNEAKGGRHCKKKPRTTYAGRTVSYVHGVRSYAGRTISSRYPIS